MNAKAVFLFFLLLAFPGFDVLYGQSPADSIYRQLSSAHLLVRLPSQQKTMAALKASLADPQLGDTARRRLQQRLEDLIAETELKNKTTVAVFKAYFDALPVHFAYDTTRTPGRGELLDEQLQPVPQEAIGIPLIQLRFGRPQVDAGNRPESMILTDSRLQDLGRPLPAPLILTGIGYGINKLLAPEIAFRRLLEKRVRKLDRQLEELLR